MHYYVIPCLVWDSEVWTEAFICALAPKRDQMIKI